MKIYYHPMSSNARRAVMTARHLELPAELVLVDLMKGAQRAPEYLAINPNGKVPTLLEDDGWALHESYAIMTYLADKAGATTLYPTDARGRANVNRWLFWAANEWSGPIARLNRENLIKPMLGLGAADPAVVKESEEGLRRLAQLVDAAASRSEWIAGPDLTLSDIALGCSLMTMGPARLPLQDFAHLLSWFGRVQALPAWQATAPTR